MRKQMSGREKLLQDVEKLLQEPAPAAANWQTALEHARRYTALLGMEPFIRREEGNVKLRESSWTSGMGYRFILSINDKEMTRSEAMRLISPEAETAEAAPEVSPAEEGEPEEESHILFEDELGKILVALNLTEGWK